MPKVYYNLKRPAFSATSNERLIMCEELYQLLAVSLNKIHNTTYSLRFWKILIEPYVNTVVRYRTILEEKNLTFRHTKYTHESMFKQDKRFGSYEKIRYLNLIISSLGNYKKIKFKLKAGHNIAAGFHDPKAIESEVDFFIDSYYPILSNLKIDISKRDISVELTEKYTKTFLLNVIKYIPKVYIEYFDYFMNKIPLFEPEKKTFHVSMLDNVFLRFILAKYTHHNAKLNYYQHGGYYGEFKYHNSHYYESSIADQFMTWGWKIKNNDMPSKAYRLEKFKRNFNKQNKKSFDLLLIYNAIYEINRDYFEKVSSLFFNKINRVKYPKICARPRPRSTFNRKGDLKFISKDTAKIDSGYTALSKLISKSKIIILMNHPSTTIFECLYVDQPVLALLDNDDPTDIVIPYYDFFLEKGMFHRTIDSLSSHLNKTEINVWWSALIKDPKYIQFKYEFLRKVQ